MSTEYNTLHAFAEDTLDENQNARFDTIAVCAVMLSLKGCMLYDISKINNINTNANHVLVNVTLNLYKSGETTYKI